MAIKSSLSDSTTASGLKAFLRGLRRGGMQLKQREKFSESWCSDEVVQ